MSTLFGTINLVSTAVAVTDCFYVSDFVAKLLQTPTGHVEVNCTTGESVKSDV